MHRFFSVFLFLFLLGSGPARGAAAEPDARLHLELGTGPETARALLAPGRGGRILAWIPAGSATNRLWQSPRPDVLQYRWRNDGGEKTWVGPQTCWEDLSTHGDWPPPDFVDSSPFTIVALTPAGAVLRSAQTEKAPFVCERTIRLTAPDTLQITAAFLPVADARADAPPLASYQIWSVAQLPFPTAAVARLMEPRRIDNGLRNNPIDPPPRLSEDGRQAWFDLAGLRLPPDLGAKCYLDADAFTLFYPDGRLHISAPDVAALPDGEEPCRAQLYVGGHPFIPGEAGRYIEVEFAGASARPFPVTFRWEPDLR